MAWSFRRKINIIPGFHLNFSRSGISSTFGPKGARLTVGRRGSYVHTSIPGTGIYSRQKLSSSSYNAQLRTGRNHDDSEKVNYPGCRLGCGFLILIPIWGIILNICDYSSEELSQNGLAAVFSLTVLIVLLFCLFRPWIKRMRRSQSSQMAEDFDVCETKPRYTIFTRLKDFFCFWSWPKVEPISYEYIISKYQQEEKKLIEQIETNLIQANRQLDGMDDPTKKFFLQSYIDCTKNRELTKLINDYHYDIDLARDTLDPLFEKVATAILLHHVYGDNHANDKLEEISTEREDLIIEQICDCGILKKNYESSDDWFLVKDMRTLKAIIKKAKGKNLLSVHDKERINEYLDIREKELTGNSSYETILPGVANNITDSYTQLLEAFSSLWRKCDKKCEILSDNKNNDTDCYTSSSVNRKYSLMYPENFNFVCPLKYKEAASFKFKAIKQEIFIYPEFVVISNSNKFDIVPLSQFDIEFKRCCVIEESTSDLPKDAKLVRYTYKHVKLNGERDARYSDNPRYEVYEYGVITFKFIGLSILFSNADLAESFVQSYQTHKNRLSDISC